MPMTARRSRHSEHLHQASVVQWAHLNRHKWPELRWLYAVPNGGLRHKAIAGQLKAEGAKKGVPDLILPAARGGYHGLYIEMKAPAHRATKARAGRESDEQAEWREALTAEGYCSVVAVGYDRAVEWLQWYCEQGRTVVVGLPTDGAREALVNGGIPQ